MSDNEGTAFALADAEELQALERRLASPPEPPVGGADSPESATIKPSNPGLPFSLADERELQNNGLRSTPAGEATSALGGDIFERMQPGGPLFAYNDTLFDLPDFDPLLPVRVPPADLIPEDPCAPKRDQIDDAAPQLDTLPSDVDKIQTNAIEQPDNFPQVDDVSALLTPALPAQPAASEYQQMPVMGFNANNIPMQSGPVPPMPAANPFGMPKLTASVVLHALTQALGLQGGSVGAALPVANNASIAPQTLTGEGTAGNGGNALGAVVDEMGSGLMPPPPPIPPPAGCAKDARARRSALLQYRRATRPARAAAAAAAKRAGSSRGSTNPGGAAGGGLKRRLTEEEQEEKRIKNRASVQACRQRKRARKCELEAERAHYTTEHEALRNAFWVLQDPERQHECELVACGVVLPKDVTDLLEQVRQDLADDVKDVDDDSD